MTSYGFIGTGVITEAVIVGMMRSDHPVDRVTVSPRNEAIAKSLADRFPKVTVGADNQSVVEASDVIVIAVLPQMAEEIITKLRVPEGKKIVSLVAGTSHARLASWTGRPPEAIVRAVPLPFVATGEGVTAVFPADRATEALFNAMGKAVVCADQNEFDLFAVATALMGSYFGILERASDWLAAKGMAREKARDVLLPLFGSLAKFADAAPAMDFTALRHHFSTKGGLNEQVFRDFEAAGGSRALTSALDRVLERAKR
jgi:pyrroline-5-carboxylate reductase